MLKNYIIFFTALLFFNFLKAQNNKESEVEKVLTDASAYISVKDFKKAYEKIINAFELSSELNNPEIEGRCRLTAAYFYSANNENESALKYYLRALSVYEKLKYPEKISLINFQIAMNYYNVEDFKSATEYFLISYKTFNTDKQEEIYKLNKIGKSYFYNNNPDSAVIFFNKAVQIASQNKDNKSFIEAQVSIIECYMLKEDYESAEKNAEVLYQTHLKNNNFKGMIIAINYWANIKVKKKEYQNAVNFYKQAIDIYEKNKIEQFDILADIYTNTGICYKNMFNYKTSLDYLNKAKEIQDKSGTEKEKARLMIYITLINIEKNDLYNASVFADLAVIHSDKSGDAELKRKSYLLYSETLKKGNDFERALEYYKKYLQINDSIENSKLARTKSRSEILELLQYTKEKESLKIKNEELSEMRFKQQELELQKLEVERKKEEQEKDLFMKKAELAEANRLRTAQALALTMKDNEALLKEKQIKELEQQSKIQQLDLERKEAEDKQKKKEIELLQAQKEKDELTIQTQKEKEKLSQFIILLGAIIFILIIFVLFWSYRKNKILKKQKNEISEKNNELFQQSEELLTQKEYLEKANEEITEKNRKISIQKEEITDSIKYANHIQTAVLPDLEEFTHNLTDFFILFKPRDIVSGDFYWAKKIDNKIIIAIADCTGHGVPGAFMSMLGISFLNEVVTQINYVNPANTLDQIREKIKEALKQTGKLREQKDGMDIVLISYEIEEMKLEFAGANNPLIFIRNNELKTISADKMPVAIHHKEKPFTNHVLDLQKGDVIYAFSDGFQDQFGGPHGRKFLTKNFKQLLLDIHQKTTEQQKEILDSALIEWKNHKDDLGNTYHQVDDILVLGIKILEE